MYRCIIIVILLCVALASQAQTHEAVERAMAANRAFEQGEQLHRQGHLREAIVQFQTALQLRQSLNDVRSAALTLDILAAIHHQLGESQSALDYFQQALTLRTDRRAQAGTLHNIGVIYAEFGEKQKALDFLDQAILLTRAIVDRQQKSPRLSGFWSIRTA